MTLARVAWEFFRGDSPKAAGLLVQGACNSVFVQNYGLCSGSWSHSWSLAVEEHFYTVFALVVAGVCALAPGRSIDGGERFRFVTKSFLAIAVLALFLRVMEVLAEYPGGGLVAYYRSHLRADGLFFGVFLGYLFRYAKDMPAWRRLGGVAATVALVAAFCWPSFWQLGKTPLAETLGFTMLYLSFGIVVAAAAKYPSYGAASKGPFGSMLRILAFLGIYSYTIYLFHAIVFGIPGAETLRQAALALLVPQVGQHAAIWMDRVVFLSISIAGGVALSHLVERPFLRLRERVLPAAGRSPRSLAGPSAGLSS
jgi:peptidoglycan/LPS O-acetylase OafA/YrhL